MLAAALLVARDEDIIGCLQEDRFHMEAQALDFQEQAGDGMGIKEVMGARVHRQGSHGISRLHTLKILHETDDHGRRKVIHTEGTHVFEIAQRSRFSRAAHTGK